MHVLPFSQFDSLRRFCVDDACVVCDDALTEQLCSKIEVFMTVFTGHTFTIDNIEYTCATRYMTRALKSAANVERFERMSRSRRLRTALDAYYAIAANELLSQSLCAQIEFERSVFSARRDYFIAQRVQNELWFQQRHVRARNIDSRAIRVRDARIIAAYRLLIASDLA